MPRPYNSQSIALRANLASREARTPGSNPGGPVFLVDMHPVSNYHVLISSMSKGGDAVWVPSDYYFEQELLGESEDSVSSPFIGCLAGVYLALAVTPFPGLNRSTVLSAFTEASFAGYARQPITWRLPYFGLNGLWNLEGACIHWQPTGSDGTSLVLGAMIVTALTGGMYLMGLPFSSPGVPMSSIQDALTCIPRFGKDPLGNWGDCNLVD